MSAGIIFNINIINNIDIITNNIDIIYSILNFLKEFWTETGYITDSVYFGDIEIKRR